MAAVVSLGACSDDQVTPDRSGNEAVILVQLDAKHTKADGLVDADDDNQVNGFTAFAFTATGTLMQSAAAVEAEGVFTATLANATTATKEVVVIANIPVGADLSDVTSKTGLEAKLATLYLTDYDTPSQTSAAGGNILASGSAPVSFSYNDTDGYTANVEVPITFVPARINVTIVNNLTGTVPFTIDDVVILNALGKTKYISSVASLVPTEETDFEYLVADGITMTDYAIYATAYESSSFLKETYTAGNSYHFYVFENTTTYPTILTLVATLGDTGEEVTKYFPVHFSPSETAVGEYPLRGNSYNVTITLSGDTGKDPGVLDPTIPVVDATLIVTVEMQSWTPRTIGKTFNYQ